MAVLALGGTGSALAQPASGSDGAPAGQAAVPSIVRPAAIGASRAFDMLERHCARCHQDGRLQDALPSRGIANILALDEIARDPSLVRPGVPDASRIYTSVLGHDMPYDAFRGQGGAEPTADEVQALRAWIADLPAGPPGTCAQRARIGQEAIAAAISEAIADQPAELTRQLRFISLANLYNACATPQELEAFRQAVVKLVNSLSWSPVPVRLEAIGPERLILRLALGEIGWIGAHWEQIVTSYPLRLAPSSQLPQPVLTATGTQVPMVNGDWLADAAMRPPLYNELLGLPGRFGNLQHILRLDVDANIRRGQARRAGVLQSRETRSNRIIERHPSAAGALWLSYDFAGNTGRQSIIEHPLGPAAEPGRVPFRHDGMKALFHLPNGFIAFSVNDVRGDRLDRSVPEMDKDRLGLTRATQSGAACLQCHVSGPIGVTDEVRAAIDAERGVSKELREAVFALYPPDIELAALVEADALKSRTAMLSAGIDPGLRVWGLEPLRALVRAHRRPLDLARAAADIGVEPDDLRRLLSDLTGPDALDARGLRQGIVRREQLNSMLLEIVATAWGSDRASRPASSAVTASGSGDRLELLLASDADTFEAGQAVIFTARASHDCWLTVIDVDKSGRATVLFPNEFEPNNQILAGKERRVPGADAPYRFRLKERGRETVIGICSRTQKAPDGVAHDFDRLRFTVLGDWNIFLREPPALDEARRDDAAGDRPGPQPRRPRAKAEPAPSRPAGADIHARTAITLDIR